MPPLSPEELERRTAREVGDALRERLKLVTARGLAVWEALPPEMRAGSAQRIAQALRLVGEDDIVTDPIRRAANEAMNLGLSQAADRLGVEPLKRRVLPPMEVVRDTVRVHDRVREEVEKAARLAATATSSADLRAAFAVAQRAAQRAETAARFAVNRSLSAGVAAVNAEHGALDLWVAERDACLHCLAYQGATVAAGLPFPEGLTFGIRPLKVDRPRPPLHPNCRCRIIPHLPSWGRDYPDALRREAQRSVLRGWHRPSEPERARLHAAEELLRRQSTLPKSVQDYARRSIRRGHFGQGGTFPDLATDQRDVIELKRPGRKRAEKVLVPEPSQPKGDAWAALPRKADLSIEAMTRRRELLGKSGAPSHAEHVEATSRDRAKDIEVTNPNFYAGREWQVNCQRAATAYELRRRGFDVEALPNRKGVDKQYTRTDLGLVWQKEWIGPNGLPRAPDAPHAVQAHRGWQYVMSAKMTELDRIVASWPPGARGWITNVWNDGGGHIWNVEKLADGSVSYVDPQMMRELDREEMKLRMRTSRVVHVMRVDDLTPTEEQIGMVKPRQ